MDRRIYGLETEYGVACTSGGTRRLTPDEVARYLFRRVVTWGRSSNVFHRDVSPSNILLGEDGAEEGARGVIIDLDHALRMSGLASEVLVDCKTVRLPHITLHATTPICSYPLCYSPLC